jgi:hypothetical protein
MLVVSVLHLHYPAATQMDALRISLESLMSSRRSFPSQLPVEASTCVSFPLLATRTIVRLRHSVM